MSRRTRDWLVGLGEVVQALREDPVLLAPALLVAGGAALAGYLLWRIL